MKKKLPLTLAAIVAICASTARAEAGIPLKLVITNGGNMPISPALIYEQSGSKALNPIGTVPSNGLVTLCQTGNPAVLSQEAQTHNDISSIQTTSGLLYPGQSVTVNVTSEAFKSIHFVGMYGMTKDTCASFDIPFSAIERVLLGIDAESTGKDQAIATGAFFPPRMPSNYSNSCVTTSSLNVAFIAWNLPLFSRPECPEV